jgi:hypothetical protein
MGYESTPSLGEQRQKGIGNIVYRIYCFEKLSLYFQGSGMKKILYKQGYSGGMKSFLYRYQRGGRV